jgi:hypothetical protein
VSFQIVKSLPRAALRIRCNRPAPRIAVPAIDAAAAGAKRIGAMDQKIEKPGTADLQDIAAQLMHASELVAEATGAPLRSDESDLPRLQSVIDSRLVEREATYSLQSLGLAFGKVFLRIRPDFDWWMVEDEFGRDPAIRYKKTTLLLFPKTMLSKRIEDGEQVDVAEIYEGLVEMVREVIAEHYREV